jgi:hypothetical protein
MLFVKLLLALAICIHLPVIAFAHPGGTDSSGGHTNHNTGDYHYHHGYPAHDHYDMDGDGIVDCPYKFDDKTGLSSGKTDSSTAKPSFDDVPSIETSKSLWDKIPVGLQAIIGLVCFYGIWSLPGLVGMLFKKIFKKK